MNPYLKFAGKVLLVCSVVAAGAWVFGKVLTIILPPMDESRSTAHKAATLQFDTSESLSEGEFFDYPSHKSATPVMVEFDNWVVTLKGAVSDEGGAAVTLIAKSEPCPDGSSQLKGNLREFRLQSQVETLTLNFKKTFCLMLQKGSNAVIAEPKGEWKPSTSAASFPDLSSAVRSFSYLDESGAEQRIFFSAVGYCESEEECSAGIAVERLTPLQAHTSMLYQTGEGLAGLTFNAVD